MSSHGNDNGRKFCLICGEIFQREVVTVYIITIRVGGGASEREQEHDRAQERLRLPSPVPLKTIVLCVIRWSLVCFPHPLVKWPLDENTCVGVTAMMDHCDKTNKKWPTFSPNKRFENIFQPFIFRSFVGAAITNVKNHQFQGPRKCMEILIKQNKRRMNILNANCRLSDHSQRLYRVTIF